MPAPSKALLAISGFSIFIVTAIFLSSSFLDLRITHPSSEISSLQFRSPKVNVWAELDRDETDAIYAFLYESPNDLNLTRYATGSGGVNYIALVEILHPNKTDALAYIDGDSEQPARWARVLVAEDDSHQAIYSNYMVGPLPPKENVTQVLPLTYCFNTGRNYVPNPIPNYMALVDRLLKLAEGVSDITEDLLGASINTDDPSDPESLGIFARIARSDKNGLIFWAQFYRLGEKTGAPSLLPQGIYFKVQTDRAESSGWGIGQWYYNGHLYPNLTEFRNAWSSSNFTRVTPNYDGSWTATEDYESSPAGRELPPPVSIQPYGRRYSISKSDSYISYFGWSLYLSTSNAVGLSLFDIRFQDTRIMYSLGLQEALAHYAGGDPFQSGLQFLDTTFFGMGGASFSLVPGYDCPAYADFLNLTFHKNGRMTTHKNAICVFEYTSDAPLSRHKADNYVSVTRNTYLVIRTVATVGNYDYTIDYILYLDGTLEVKMRASGFIWAAFFPDDADTEAAQPHDEYSYRVHNATMSSMHDHVLNFRADLDIGGPTNIAHRIAVAPTTKRFPWDPPDVPGSRSTMHLTHTPITHETGLTWPPNANEMLVVLNPALRNAWGELRGYRIAPGTGMGTPAHLTIHNSTALGRSAAWAAADLWLLRTHASEPRTASELNMWDPWDPLVDFAAMLDGERIDGQDLVLLFNLGAHHVPTAQDIPNTLGHTSASAVAFVPHNFADRDASRAAAQGVRVDHSVHGEPQTVKYFGTPYADGLQLPKEALEPDLAAYDFGRGPQWIVKAGVERMRGLLSGFGFGVGVGGAAGLGGGELV